MTWIQRGASASAVSSGRRKHLDHQSSRPRTEAGTRSSSPTSSTVALNESPICRGREPGMSLCVAGSHTKESVRRINRRQRSPPWPRTSSRQQPEKNIKKAAGAAKAKKSLAHMSSTTKTALGKQRAAVAARKRSGGSSPKARVELYEEAKQRGIPGRSKMGRAELARRLGHG
jgi:hypothetical protein